VVQHGGFGEEGRGISGLLEVEGEGVMVQRGSGMPSGAPGSGGWIETGKQGGNGFGGVAGGAYSLLKYNALVSQAAEKWRGITGIAIERQMIGAESIYHDDDDVVRCRGRGAMLDAAGRNEEKGGEGRSISERSVGPPHGRVRR
jgi:hypothetical protein